jgi:DNA polymerase-3 subunit gamma/tau
MSYLVLARKHRPRTFEEVIAQEHVTITLRNALRNDRVGCGYLFCGPRGTGKTTIARILAKCVNCVEGPTDTPCGECFSCKEITSGSSLDVLEIDAASNTGVDDIRTLRENIRYLPTSGKKRIYIIDEVHRLSGSAFDALLKTLEEPPDHVMFLFATTEPLRVPETILSRTQRFDLRRVPIDDLAEHLRKVADKEDIKIDKAAVKLLARKADGSVRDCLSLLDQISAFAGEGITEDDVVRALGLVDRQFLTDYTNAIGATDRQKVLQMTRRIFDQGIDVSDFAHDLLEHFRVLMVLGSDPATADLLDLSEAELDSYKEQADYFSTGDVLRMIRIISDVSKDLKEGLDERLVLEVAGVKMAELERTVLLEEVLRHLEGGAGSGAGAEEGEARNSSAPSDLFTSRKKKNDKPGESSPELTKQTTPFRPLPAYSRAVNLPQLQAGWDSFLNALKNSSRMLSSQLRMAEVQTVKGNEIELLFYASGEASLQLVQKPDNLNLILKVLREHFRANLSIRFKIDKQKENPNLKPEKPHADSADPEELLESSPRLRMLVDKVNGEIIGVRKTKK